MPPEHNRTTPDERFGDSRFLFESSMDAVFIGAPDGSIINVNQAWLDLFGYTREELASLSAVDSYANPEERDDFVRRMWLQGVVHDEVLYRRKDGSTFLCQRAFTAVRDESGRVVAYQGINRDISRERETQERLRRSEMMLAHSQQIGHIGSWELNLRDNRLTWSDETYRIFGLEPQEFAATYEAFLDAVHPEDRARLDEAYTASVREGRDGYEIEHRILRQDTGEIRHVHEKCMHVRDAAGAIIQSTGFVQDITDGKLTETYRGMRQEILRILNEPGDLQESIQRVLGALKTWTGVDAVGLRLQEGEDFPYFAQDGFSKDFLLSENTLLERGKDGGVCRDKDGNVCLECTCGLVISGKTDPSNPLFTQGGSCWTNDSFPFLDLPSDQDPRMHPRNNCIHQGYASVALTPVRFRDRIVGLIQLNDKRKGRFTLETIEVLEGIAAHIGSALMRKQAEEKLQERERYLSTVLHTTRDGFWVLDAEGKLIDVNDAYCRMSGYTRDELLQLRILNIEALEKPDETAARIERIRKNGSELFQTQHRRKDGSIFDVEVSVSCLPGPVEHLACFCRDISERKQAELQIEQSHNQYQSLVFSIPGVVFRCSPDRERPMVYVSDDVERLSGYPASDFAGDSGRTWGSVVHGDDSEYVVRTIDEAIEADQPWEIEYRIRHRDGSIRWVHERGTGVVDVAEREAFLEGLILDVTDQKRVRDELQRSHVELQRLAAHLQSMREEERAAVAWELHDEVAQALAVIRMDITECNNRLPAEVQAQVETQLHATQSLLDETIGRLRRLYTDLRPGMLEDLGLSATIEWQTEEFARDSGIDCRIVQLDEVALPDIDRSLAVYRVFQEILRSGVRHSGATTVEVSVVRHPEHFEVRISDNGPGVTEEELLMSESLDFVAMRERLRGHGGNISIRRNEAGGTLAEISVPLVAASAGRVGGSTRAIRTTQGPEYGLPAHDAGDKEVSMGAAHDSYRNLVDSLPDGYAHHRVVLDDRGKPVDYIFRDVNPAFERLTGLERARIIGRRATEVLPGIEHSEFDWIGTYGQVAATGQTVTFERYSEPLSRWYEVTAYRDKPGQFVTVFHDVTDRKEAEQALHESEEMFRTLFEQSVAPMSLIATDGHVLEANQTWLELFGFSRANLPTLNVRTQYLDPAERERFIREIETSGSLVDQEVRLKRKDGAPLDLLRSVTARYGPDGRIIAYHNVFSDITAQKQAERALRESERLLRETERLSRLGGWSYDVAAKHMVWTRGVYDVHEMDAKAPVDPIANSLQCYAPGARELDAKAPVDPIANSLQCYAPGARERVEEAFRRAVKEGIPYDLEVPFTTVKGKRRWVRTVGRPEMQDGTAVRVTGNIVDVTEQHEAAEALRKSDEKYRTLFRQSMDAIALVSPDGFILEANPAFCGLFGYSEEELVDFDSAEMYVDPDGRQRFLEAIGKRGALVDDEVQLRKKDGTVMDCLRTVTTRRDQQGNVVGYQPVIRDITTAKRAEYALRQSEERYRALIDQSVEMIYLHDVDGTILQVNPAATSWTGYSRNELLQMTVFDLHADASGREDIVHQWKAWQPGMPVTLETVHKRKDGSIRQVEVKTCKVLIGDARLILALVRDITGRKANEQALRESEGKYRTLFEQSRDAIYIATPDGKSLDWNQAWLDLLGYTREESSRLSASDIYADPASRDDHVKRLERQGHVQDDECRLRRKDGTVLDCLRTVTIRRDAEGRSIAYQGVVRDVTQQKHDQKELDVSRMELQALAARLEEIREVERTGIARELHDQVGQALTALRMDLDAVRRALDRREEAPLARLNRMADLLDETVNDVRRISSELRPGILDDAGLAAAMEWQLDRLRERSTLHCSIEVQADDSVLTPPQSTALFRVFQELLTNVVRHAAAGSVSVTLSSDCNRFALTVADDGRGITDEQADDAGSLGLIGIRERLRPLGGDIHFWGGSGKGTTVCVTVPLR